MSQYISAQSSLNVSDLPLSATGAAMTVTKPIVKTANLSDSFIIQGSEKQDTNINDADYI